MNRNKILGYIIGLAGAVVAITGMTALLTNDPSFRVGDIIRNLALGVLAVYFGYALITGKFPAKKGIKK